MPLNEIRGKEQGNVGAGQPWTQRRNTTEYCDGPLDRVRDDGKAGQATGMDGIPGEFPPSPPRNRECHVMTKSPNRALGGIIALSAVFLSGHAIAQDGDYQPTRTRVALGPQLVPTYPGADGVSLRPLIDLSRATGDEPFGFEAADEGFGFALYRADGFSIGPSIGFEGKRTADDVGTQVPDVGFTVEAGGFAQYELTEALRLRVEARQGIGGHKGFISVLSADYVTRDGDRQLLAFGPRVTITDNRYQDAYFSVRPGDAALSGLPAFNAGGGVQSVGAAASYIRQFTQRWGIYSYARYDRLIGDAGDSPLVRQYGSRDQLSGGVALTYTF